MKAGLDPEVDEALLAHVGTGQRAHGERQRDDRGMSRAAHGASSVPRDPSRF